MKRFQEVDPAFQYYELPTIDKLSAVARWFIDSGMRRGIPDKNARARTITLYIDKQPFKNSLQLPTEKTVYALLVDRSGERVVACRRHIRRGQGREPVASTASRPEMNRTRRSAPRTPQKTVNH